MLLHSVEVQGFKGIKDLVIDFNEDISVLIGENSWGSSSLISALSMIAKENFMYECQDHDFYHEQGCDNDCLQVRFIYTENNHDDYDVLHNIPELSEVSYFDNYIRKQVICYQVSASKGDGGIKTRHNFVDHAKRTIEVENFNERLEYLINLSPLIIFNGNALSSLDFTQDDKKIKTFYDLLLKQLSSDESELTDKELEQGLYAAVLMLTYYSIGYQKSDEYIRKPTLEDWQILDKINDLLDQLGNTSAKSAMMKFFSGVIFHRMRYQLADNALPILFLRGFGGNTHPIITSVGMRLLKNIPVQKILTSNTSDLIPMLSLQNVMRISRLNSDIVVNQVLLNDLKPETNRKVLFHIFHRRPVALFARCWFLVEGETEIWLLRELADICGYNLSAEGVTLIEFAQCGIISLIEYAQAMGIEWYAMSDGDAAGRHYAKTVRSHCKTKENYYKHMTQLPARDIENFLFKKGFSSVYKEVAYGSTEFVEKPVHDIIQRAVQKTSKPDLALAVADFARARGARAVPPLLQSAFKKAINLSKFMTEE